MPIGSGLFIPLTISFFVLATSCTNITPELNLSSFKNFDGTNKISVQDQFVPEYGIAKIKVSLSAAAPNDVSFNYYTQDSSALQGSEFWGFPIVESATIPAGQSSIELPVSIRRNYVKDVQKNFFFNISNINGVATGQTSALIQIQEDDMLQLQNVSQVEVGDYHACLLTTSGGVKCWGKNLNGQVGDGTTTDRNFPTDVSGLTSGVSQIAVGSNFSCARLGTGELKCWGGNSVSQLGNGNTIDQLLPVSIIASGVTKVALGGGHGCVIISGGDVKCWGYNSNGQLGDGTTTDRSTPFTDSFFDGITNIATDINLGVHHSCALTNTGGMKCWGNNLSGQLGDTTTTSRSSATNVSGLLSGVSSIYAGGFNSCALLSSGQLKCWGKNNMGQIGDLSTTQRTSPTAVNSISSSATLASVGENHSCVVHTNQLKCWGINSLFQLGSSAAGVNYSSQPLVTDNVSIGSVAVISAGKDNTCLVTTDNRMQCWGSQATLIPGSDVDQYVGLASDVSGVPAGGIIHGSVSDDHTCVVLQSGQVQCWGMNVAGQLGTGDFNRRYSAVNNSVTNAKKIASGSTHTCALDTAGAVFCWGDDSFGQVGNSTPTATYASPQATTLSSNVKSISAAANNSCAILNDTSLQCWGNNSNGQVGDSTSTNRVAPTLVTGMGSGVLSVAIGGNHTCAVMSTGQAKCWGYNGYGQLGEGTTTDSLSPVLVSGISNAVGEIAAGSNHSCVVTTSRTVKCWGENIYGQLGDGTTNTSSVPVDVLGLNDVSQVVAGNNHTCALTNSGKTFCWGDNNYAQLGLGYSSPSPVTTPSSALGLELGGLGMTAGGNNVCLATKFGDVKCWGDNTYGQVGSNYNYNVPQFFLSP